MNNITINWSAEDRARADKLIELLEGQTAPRSKLWDTVDLPVHPATLETPEKPTEMPKNDAQPEAVKVDGPLEEIADLPDYDELPVPEPQPEPKYEQADVMAKVQALIQAGKKDDAKAVVKKYAASVSGIPADKYPEVMAELNALEV